MLTDAGVAALVAMCSRLGCDPIDLLSVAANESGIKTTAHNAGGDASGLWQLMPATARGLGWNVSNDPHLAKFRALCDVEQIHWFEKYFMPHSGHLVTAAACYVATFLPADTAAAWDPHHVLARARVVAPDGTVTDPGFRDWAYHPNSGFDTAKKGYIEVADLQAAIDRATARLGQDWIDQCAAIQAARPA